jgi:acid-sensing ion channel, other
VAHSWSLDKGYAISNLLDLYPKRALAGADNGLFVLLRLYKKDLDFICRGPLQGFKVAVHAPNSVPKMEKHYFRVPLEQEVIATISLSVTTHSDELRQLAPNERQCYFHDERQLKFFKEYTQENCELECAASYVKEHCGCVRFNMPSKRNRIQMAHP